MKTTTRKSIFFLIAIVALLTWVSPALAGPEIKSVYPTLGALGSPLSITIRGSGFDGSTRVSMAMDQGNSRFVVSGVEALSGYAWDVIIDGNIAYVAYGPSPWEDSKEQVGGLQVVDISNLENLQVIAEVETIGPAYSMALQNDHLFIAGGSNQLQVVDVSNPANPQKRTSGKNIAPAKYKERYVKIYRGMAYVADAGNGLYVIDISDPAAPLPLYNKTIGVNAKSIDFKDNYAFVTGQPEGKGANGALVVVDVTDPSAMAIVGSVTMPTWWVQNVKVGGNYAYVAMSDAGIQVVDISNPGNPFKVMPPVDTDGRAWNITFSGQTAYVADELLGVTVLDVTDPTDISLLGSVDTPEQALGIALKDDHAFVADGEAGLQVVDITAPQLQQAISRLTLDGNSFFFDRKGNFIYLANGSNGLQVIDISDPSSPTLVESVETDDFAFDVDVVGDYAYVADTRGGLQVVSLADGPQKHTVIGSYEGGPGPEPADLKIRHVTVEGGIAYLADAADTLGYEKAPFVQLIDVSTPSSPDWISAVPMPSNIDGKIAINGNYAYAPLKGNGTVQVIDISDSENAAIIGQVDTLGGEEGARWITIAGSRAYLANGNFGISVLDISNPASPVILGEELLEDRAYSLVLDGSTAYVADGDQGVQVVDVSDPANMVITGNVDTTGGTVGVAIQGDIAFVSDFGNGLIVVPLPIEVKPVTVVSANKITCTLPSPTTPGHYILRVFNNSDDPFDMRGAVTFSDDVKNSKAIIVAAGNYTTPQEQKLEEEFQQVANEAYNAFLYQGFRKDDILYLGPDPTVDADGLDGDDDVDRLNTIENINWAFNTWAVSQSPHDIYVYLVGHGSTGYYKPNQERMLADEVKALVTGLQSMVTGNVIFIYEACQSGAFLLNMDESPGNSPVIITSSKSNQESWFYDLGDGLISFSSGFWESVLSRQGAKLDKAFSNGKNKIKDMQTAWMDVNGDLLPNTGLDTTEIIIIGRGYPPRKPLPIIGNVSASLNLSGGTIATIWATGIAVSGEDNDVAEVFAIITPPCYNPLPSTPGTEDDLEKVTLTDANTDGVYEYDYQDFSIQGTYVVTIYARDSEGRLSDPNEMYVYKSSGGDIYEENDGDDTYLLAQEITLNDSMAQCHNFFDVGDEDWIKFFALAGQIYLIEASNLGPGNNVVIEIFDTDGTTLLTLKDNLDIARADEALYWRCNEDGLYFARIRPAGPENFGPETDYRLEIYRPVADLIGFISGTIKDQADEPVEGVTIKTDIGASGLSKGGAYFMVHRAGNNIQMTMKANGYQQKDISGIVVDEARTTRVDANLEPMVVDTEPSIDIVSPNGNVTIFEGESVNFLSSTTNGNAPFTYAWDFSGGAANTAEKNPGDVTFATDGIYTVSVTVTDEDKDSDTSKPVTVTVNNNLDPTSVPEVSITSPAANKTIVAGQTVNFQASLQKGNAPFDYTWDFNGGAAQVKDEDPGDVAFATPGTYTVRVTVADNENDQDSAQVTVTVVADLQPIAEIQSPASNVDIDTGAVVNFQGSVTSGNPLFDYTWDFDGAALASTAEDPGQVTFAVPGTYTITFTVEDIDGDTHSDTVTVTVNRTNGGGGGGGGGGCFLTTVLP